MVAYGIYNLLQLYYVICTSAHVYKHVQEWHKDLNKNYSFLVRYLLLLLCTVVWTR